MDHPVRENPRTHECVCLLIQHQPVLPTPEDLEKLVVGQVSPMELIEMREVKDKCHATVNNPDQPFCNDCELAEHPEAHNQAYKRIKKETK